MPYSNISELDKRVRNNLPKHAQEIYLKAFNNAYEQYKDPNKRRDPKEDPETVAHKVAWSAVEEKYKKDKESGKWVER